MTDAEIESKAKRLLSLVTQHLAEHDHDDTVRLLWELESQIRERIDELQVADPPE